VITVHEPRDTIHDFEVVRYVDAKEGEVPQAAEGKRGQGVARLFAVVGEYGLKVWSAGTSLTADRGSRIAMTRFVKRGAKSGCGCS